jgi:Zn-dependent protease with chaperone function
MAARTRYAPDRGLTVRMTATLFLLGLVFVAFVALIIGIMTAAHASGAAIILVAVIFGGGSAFISLFFSDKIALAAAGARVVTPKEAPELHGIVDRLCALGLLVRFAFYSELFGGARRSNDGNAALLIPLILLASALVYAISFLLIRLLSRYRELAADRSGALLTQNPSALISALTKVSQGMNRIPTQDLRAAEPLNAFYFAPAMKLSGGRGGGASLSTLFSTHPSLDKRIEQLSKIQRELGQVGSDPRGLQ